MDKIICFGSVNIDCVYQVPHFVRPGETLTAARCDIFAGGKGLNQSIAAARAGSRVYHAGKIGRDGEFLRDMLKAAGVHVRYLVCDRKRLSGQAMIQITPEGENAIIISGGANQCITEAEVRRVIGSADSGDMLLLQNEINHLELIMRSAAERKLKIAVNFAPFDLKTAQALPLELAEYLIVNETEGAELSGRTGQEEILEQLLRQYPDTTVIMTLGAAGAVARTPAGAVSFAASPKVKAIDTTAAGDTFVGYFLDGRRRGLEIEAAMGRACRAAAITVTRPGAAGSIPDAGEVD